MTPKISQALNNIKPISPHLLVRAQEHMDSLTKPPGSLGRLEEWGTRFAAINNCSSLSSINKCVYLFAGDHGVVDENVSAYPQKVTAQMVHNFLAGGAAINVLARQMNTKVKIIDIGVNHDFGNIPGLTHKKIALGTINMAKSPCMTLEQAESAIEVGIDMADSAKKNNMHIIGTGDMGIGNTTPSSAIISVLGGFNPRDTTGKGTGIDNSVWIHKVSVIEKAIALNKPSPENPIDVLAKVGGYEIAGIAGLILGAAAYSIPIVIDGVISIAGAVIAQKLNNNVKDYLFASHKSTEPGCEKGFQIIQQKPILDLDMRLGEGTGAVIAMNLLEAGNKIYSEMATFESAKVSPKNRN